MSCPVIMARRCACVILLGIGALQSLASQIVSGPGVFPSVSISLPPNVASETVQIAYHLVGPFGGYGGDSQPKAGVRSYEIEASREGEEATEARLIVYAPGCEFETYVVPLSDIAKVNKQFECTRAESVALVGQVIPQSLVQGKNAELIVSYMAHWSHEFFGIVDGAIVEFTMATTCPDADGMFRVDLPVFRSDAVPSFPERRASFHLILRDSKTWNQIATMEPEAPDLKVVDHTLRIETHYSSGTKFNAMP
jgi:hypothetical protein